MAISKKITITEAGVNSGPTYDVYYSLDGSTYTFLETVTLSGLGASVIVSVPDTTQYIKLVSIGTCTNEVIEPVPGASSGDFNNDDFSPLDFS